MESVTESAVPSFIRPLQHLVSPTALQPIFRRVRSLGLFVNILQHASSFSRPHKRMRSRPAVRLPSSVCIILPAAARPTDVNPAENRPTIRRLSIRQLGTPSTSSLLVLVFRLRQLRRQLTSRPSCRSSAGLIRHRAHVVHVLLLRPSSNPLLPPTERFKTVVPCIRASVRSAAQVRVGVG